MLAEISRLADVSGGSDSRAKVSVRRTHVAWAREGDSGGQLLLSSARLVQLPDVRQEFVQLLHGVGADPSEDIP